MAKPFMKITTKTSLALENIPKASEKAEKAYLFRVGGYALKTAKSLLKTAKTKYANPGKPPRSKTGAMRRGMAFNVSMKERSVIIGPRRDTNKKNSLVLHEEGGRTQGKAGYVLIPNSEIRGGDISKDNPVLDSKVRAHSLVFLPAGTRNYKPRPYMAPALKKTTDQDQTRFWMGVSR